MTLPLHRLNFVPEMIAPPNAQPLLPDRARPRGPNLNSRQLECVDAGGPAEVEWCKGAIIQHHKLHKVARALSLINPCAEVLTVASLVVR